MTARPVLVTGGAGYIGSHTAKALAAAGLLPIAVDNLSRGFEEAVRWGPLERGDIADRQFLDAVFRRWQPTAILHFAAFAYVGESVSDPGLYYRNNVAGSLALIEAARDHAVKSFVFSSTCATYGQPARMPITEDTPQYPVNPYGASKLMVERILADFAAPHGLRSMALRYFNAAGADPDGDIGENHDPETHLIPLAIYASLGLAPKLQIFGTDYPTPDGTCVRDYIHVTDLADAHVRALSYLEGGGATGAANLGTGSGLSVREIVDSVTRATGRSVPCIEAPRRPGDVPILVADAGRAQKMLGWQPRLSAPDSMVAGAVAWARRRHNRPAG
jgi:UDP-arabinose 4-epimerase